MNRSDLTAFSIIMLSLAVMMLGFKNLQQSAQIKELQQKVRVLEKLK